MQQEVEAEAAGELADMRQRCHMRQQQPVRVNERQMNGRCEAANEMQHDNQPENKRQP